MTKKFVLLILFTALITATTAQDTERMLPSSWSNLVKGGRFMDRFLPLPDLGAKTTNTWGTLAVKPREINNGIEDPDWSYWGGNIRLLEDGKYHLFVCRWAENSKKGHMEWPRSIVVHAVADNPSGPFKVIDEVGKGHNPEWFINTNGKYLIYIRGKYYISDSINGPWEQREIDLDKRDRKILELISNLTFAEREDGSMLMVNRGGGVWISKDGISTWHQVSDETIYPKVEGRFEDPVIWKDQVQYHLIVNDWLGRIAWYLRSKDGIHWKTDDGEAYQPGIANHTDGTKEDWYKYERIKILQDKYGRAIQANFAVIDTIKRQDLPNDHHSSKNLCIPLVKDKLISIQNKKKITAKTKKIVLEIKGEKGFNPNTDIDLTSLRLGASGEVNFGRGAKAISITPKGNNAMITFDGKGNGISENNFATKLLGKDKKGNLLMGYSRLPKVDYIEAHLSPLKPKITNAGTTIEVEIQNFGQVASRKSYLQVFTEQGEELIEIGSTKIPSLQPLEKVMLQMKLKNKIPHSIEHDFVVIINKNQKTTFSTSADKE